MYKDSKLSFYQVDIKYMRYLLQNGIKVMDSSSIDKQNRKYIGIIIKNQSNQEYLIPLASPKPKHINMKNKLDFIKIEDGKLGVININNMIPVNPSVYTGIKINEQKDTSYKSLLTAQYQWINSNGEKIVKNA